VKSLLCASVPTLCVAAALVQLATPHANAAPAISVAPIAIDFGPTAIMVGLSSSEHQVLLESVGADPLLVRGFGLKGANPADFATNSCAPVTYPPGGSCKAFVSFKPKAAGPRSADLVIVSDDPQNPRILVHLTGMATASAPRLSVQSNSLEFGTQPIGSSSAPLDLAVRSAGTLPLQITSVQSNGAEFAVVSPSDCGLTLLAAVTSGLQPTGCDVLIQFTPAGPGPRTAVLTIASDDPNGPVQIIMHGSGAAPAISVPASLNFGSWLAGELSPALPPLAVLNSGTAPLTVSGAAITGPNEVDFSVSSVIPCTVDVGLKCNIQLRFQPHGSGPRSAQLVITSDALGQPTTIVQLAGFAEFVTQTLPPSVPPTDDVRFCAAGPPAPGMRPVCTVTPATCSGVGQTITLGIPVTRAFGSRNPVVSLPPPVPPTIAPAAPTVAAAITAGTMFPTATLKLMTFVHGPPGPSAVALNGSPVGTFSPVRDTWTETTLTFPAALIRFPGVAPLVPATDPLLMNTVVVTPDVAQTGGCVAIAWAWLHFRAMSPVVFVHGNGSDGAFFIRQGTVGALNAAGIPNDSSIMLASGGAATVAAKAMTLQSLIPPIVRSFGVDSINIIAHSKGGLDVRSWLSTNDTANQSARIAPFRVLSVSTLATPHRGSAGADLLLALDATTLGIGGLPVASLSTLGLGPSDAADPDLSTPIASTFNPSLPPAADYRMFGGSADRNGDFAIESRPIVAVDEYAAARSEQPTLLTLFLAETAALGRAPNTDALVTALYRFLFTTRTVVVIPVPVLLIPIPLLPPEFGLTISVPTPIPGPPSPNDLLVTTGSSLGGPAPFVAPLPPFLGTADHASSASGAVAGSVIPFLITTDATRGDLR